MSFNLFLAGVVLFLCSCVQMTKSGAPTRNPDSQNISLVELIYTKYGPNAVCNFNNSIKIEPRPARTQFSLTFSSAISFKNQIKPAEIKLRYTGMQPEFDTELTFRLTSIPGIYISEELLAENLDGAQGVKIFDGHRNLYLKEVYSAQKDFSMYHEGPINFEVKELLKYPTLVPSTQDSTIARITLYDQRCHR